MSAPSIPKVKESFLRNIKLPAAALAGLALLTTTAAAVAHGVSEGDAAFLEESSGRNLLAFTYLGAKHMFTGYDHILFLLGVVFFLYRMKDVGIYVTLFAIGHSITLLLGVLGGFHVNPYIVDAIIGLSVVYKALDNMGAFRRWFGFQPNTKAAVMIFGLFHGLGLATKLQDFSLSPEGLVANMLAFNVGVEIGQLLALAFILIVMGFWRRSPMFARQAFGANAVLMTAGFLLIGYQLTGYFVS
ncbi:MULTISPECIES: HupE/UreJ family protein [Stenotrophomonas]|uniref:Membrane protein n=1 Tax=Stenotrophomonas nitritireducens TaxID=83617 RepID=A0ABR5NNB5_9GAMM|nr:MULTISPECIES: HupE/UreJ family protein [Stenotrophomonas]KRG60210.1 membrane protein [Stenotrophomonas nitritireducens]MBH1826817.1 HupE/UreJ family protein [Stenotrophomonas maltophilia]